MMPYHLGCASDKIQ